MITKDKNKIRLLFQRLEPIIEDKLMKPGAPEFFRSGRFLYDGFDSEDLPGATDVAQLSVVLNGVKTESQVLEESLTVEPSGYRNVWLVDPKCDIAVPWEAGWKLYLMVSLKTDFRQNYMLCVSLVCCGFRHVASHGEVVVKGSFADVVQAVRSGKFSSRACAAFYACLEAVSIQIEESVQERKEALRFEETDITDYDSLMGFVESVKNRRLLKSKGKGLELFTYDSVVSLVDRSSKSVKLLVDRNGKAQFCSIDDFPDTLLNMIRLEKTDWNLDVHELSVGPFNSKGLSLVTWVISPYYYCPMDEDGFGEEEEYEVAVTCHIDTSGRLADTPLWKPYTGPRR